MAPNQRLRLAAIVSLLIAALLVAVIGGGLYGWYVWLPRRTPTSEGNEPPADLTRTGRPVLLDPTEEAMANNMGVSFAARGEYDQAMACFRMAVSRKDDYLPGWKNLLAALVETGRWPEALEAAEKAEELHPLRAELRSEEPPPSTGSGQAPSTGSGQAPSTGSGQTPDARSQLVQDRDFLANLARAYLEGGQLEKARSRFTLYVRLFPRELRGYNGLGEVAFREGDYERAVQLFAQSPLYVAMECSHEDVCRFLLGLGAEHDVFTAAGAGDTEVLERLLHASVWAASQRDRAGRTPLHWAAEFGHADAVRLLLEEGADAEAEDSSGRTPLALALAGRHEVVARILEEHGSAR